MKTIFPRKAIFWGGTGQCKVMRPILEHYGSELVVVVDRTLELQPPFPDIPLIHDSNFEKWYKEWGTEILGFCITIGNPHGLIRITLHKRLVELGLEPVTLIHPTAWISHNAIIGAGSQIHTHAIVEVEAKIGLQCIINTKASVDHECVLEDGTELGPGATLCGSIRVREGAWIGAGATVLPRLTIGKRSIVGAGAVVTKNVPDDTVVIGVPAKPKI